VSGYRERLLRFVEAQSVELSFSERIAPAKGLSHGGKITLLSGMQPAEEFSTLVHEIAHEMLHRGDRRTLTTKQVRETEAEAVAFVVCQSVGLQNGTAAQDYIQLWHGDANLLRESLEAVQSSGFQITLGTRTACLQHRHHCVPRWQERGVCLRSYPTRRPHAARGRGISERPDHHRPRIADRQAPGFATAGSILCRFSGLVDERREQPSPNSSPGVSVMRCTA
jgi:hypothetical protein